MQDSVKEILNILRKRSSYRDLAKEFLQDPDAKFALVVLPGLGAEIRDTEILHKRSS